MRLTALLAAALAVCARPVAGDVVSEIEANAQCMHAELLLEQYGAEALRDAEVILRGAHETDASSRAREMLVDLARVKRELGMPADAATEAIIASPARVSPAPGAPAQPPAPRPPVAAQALAASAAPLAVDVDGDPGTRRVVELVREAAALQARDVDSFVDTPRVIELYRAALALIPDLRAVDPALIGTVLESLAIALRAIDRVDEAVVELRRATEINPNEARHRMNLAGTLYMQGEMKAAAEQCRHALRLNPMHAKALSILTAVEPITSEDDERLALLMRHAAADPQLSVEARALTHFGLFRALDKLKRHEDAWLHLEEGNALALLEMSQQGPLPEEGGMAEAYQRLTAAFDAPTFAALAEAADAARAAAGDDDGGARAVRSPEVGSIFIVGAYRSGSTLVEQILSSHSAVHGAGENTALGAVLGGFQQSYFAQKGAVFPEGFVQLARSGEEPLLFEKLGEEYARAMRESRQVARSGKPRWADKNLGNSHSVGLIVAALPNAKVVHTLRSPIATCFSMYTQHFTQGSAASRYFTCSQRALGAHYTALHGLMRSWDGAVPPGRMLTVRYEDMVANQEAATRRLVAFVGLPWEEACLLFHKQNRAVATASLSQVRQPMYNSSVDSWRRYERQLRPLVEQLEQLGEQPWRTEAWPDQPTAEEWAAMRAQDAAKA